MEIDKTGLRVSWHYKHKTHKLIKQDRNIERYKCRYCGETEEKKMLCYNRAKTLYASSICYHCYMTKIRGMIPIKLKYENGVLIGVERL